jgi:hypothetical protein
VCTRWENFLRIGITVRYLKSWRCELWIWRSHFGTSSGYGILNSTHAILGSINRTRKLFIRKLSRYKTLCITVIDNSFNYHYFHITGSRNVWDCATLREHVGSPPFFCGERFCSSFEFFVLYYFWSLSRLLSFSFLCCIIFSLYLGSCVLVFCVVLF